MTKKKLIRLTLLVILCTSFLVGQFISVGAQNREVPLAQTTPTETAISMDATQVPFKIFKDEDTLLLGPYSSIFYSLGIPNSWALLPGAELHLDMTVNFTRVSSSGSGSESPVMAGGGSLTLYLNNILLGIVSLNETGNIQATLPIPPSAFSNSSNGRMAFSAVLDAGFSCYLDENFSLVIHPTSYFSLPHDIKAPAPEIVNLSKILYQGTFIRESALIVVPDQPTAAELQSALTVAGGLGSLSGNKLPIDLTTMSALTSEQKESNHLILVGRPAAFNLLEELTLPLPPDGGTFQITTGITDAGIIELVNSPWSASGVVVLVSGNSDAGTVKAAQAISTGIMRPNRFPNLAVVEDIQPPKSSQLAVTAPETRTLASMGYSNNLFNFRGANVGVVGFQVPLGWTVAENSYFELAYGNSSLLDFDQSGIAVSLNGIPIGSVRFDAETSKNAINRVKMSIPQSVILSGYNQIEIQGYIYPNDVCAPPDAEGNWINIWGDSVLSMPLIQKQVDTTTALNLADYPAPFIFGSELNNTAFVLPKNNPDAWRGAVKISSYLASQANPPIITLSAFFGDEFPEERRQDYHVILIGRPSQLPVVDELGPSLPVPFEAGSDKAIEGNVRVLFNIPEDAPLGYVELLTSPWNSQNIIVAILGTTTQGEIWAVSAMTNDNLRSGVSGNLAIVNGTQVLSSDTRVFPISSAPPSAEETPSVSIVQTPAPDNENASASQSNNWIPMALIIGLVLIVSIISVVMIRQYTQKRSRM